jgi:AcrR family transcriptional regulator
MTKTLAPSRMPAASPSPRQPLTPARIAEAALRLIDRDGLDALSMRKLGLELGVEAMALYHHVANKGRVLDAVMDLLVQEIEIPPPGSMPTLERLRQALRSYRAIALRHPHAFVLLATRRFNSDGTFAVYERLLQAFAELGLPPQRAAWWFRATGTLASGTGLADIASRELEPNATPLTLQGAASSAAQAAALPPHVAAVAPFLAVERLDEAFEFALDQFMDALERDVRALAVPAATGRRSRGRAGKPGPALTPDRRR